MQRSGGAVRRHWQPKPSRPNYLSRLQHPAEEVQGRAEVLAGVLIGRAAVFTRSRAGRLIAFTADGQEPPTAPWRTDARALVPAR